VVGVSYVRRRCDAFNVASLQPSLVTSLLVRSHLKVVAGVFKSCQNIGIPYSDVLFLGMYSFDEILHVVALLDEKGRCRATEEVKHTVVHVQMQLR